MKVNPIDQAPAYTPPNHVDVRSVRLHGGAEHGASFCTLGLSYYPPMARADMDSSPQEKVYLVLQGEFTVTLGSGEVQVLKPFDTAVLEKNEMRKIENRSGETSVLLVISPPPSA